MNKSLQATLGSIKRSARNLVKSDHQPRKRLAESTGKAGAIEVLEQRIAPAATVNGVFADKWVRKASFTDADGDKVIIGIRNAPLDVKFKVTLDGGVLNRADIESIEIADTRGAISDKASAYITILVVPRKSGSPNFVEIGNIFTTQPELNLRGIAMRSAAADNIDILGDITNLAIDLRKSDPFGKISPDKIGFGNVTVGGDVGSLTLRGRADFTNDIRGDITIGGNLGALNATYSDLHGFLTVGAGGIGSISAHDILAPVVSLGGIGSVTANHIDASVKATGAIDRVVANDIKGKLISDTAVSRVVVKGGLSGDILVNSPTAGPLFLSVADAISGNISLAGVLTLTTEDGADFTGNIDAGRIQGTGPGGLLTFNGGNFTGIMKATANALNPLADGSISSIDLANPNAIFSGTILATGAVGNINAAAFQGATVTGASIGVITSEAGTGGIEGSTFVANAGGIAGVSSVASIVESSFQSAGAIGNVSVLKGGLHDSVFTGYAGIAATSIGNVVVSGPIEGNTFLALGSIGSVVSTTGAIGGSAPVSGYIDDITSGVPQFTGPAGNFISGGSVGDIIAKGDIAGNVVIASGVPVEGPVAQIVGPGSIGNITAQAGRIAFNEFTANVSIGNIEAHSGGSTIAFDVHGNPILSSVLDLDGNLSLSGAAIQGTSFIASSGTIGNVTASAGAFGGRTFLLGAPVTVGAEAIIDTTFAAGAGIGNVTARATSAGDIAAIARSNFVVTSADLISGAGGVTAIGIVDARAVGGDAIVNTTLNAVSGNISNVTGTSTRGHGIYQTVITAARGNVGVVTGTALGGNGGGGLEGLHDVAISAGSGPGGTGRLAGVVGTALDEEGILDVIAVAGTGGIGLIRGTTTGLLGNEEGIDDSRFFTTGAIDTIEGTSTSGDGIQDSVFSADGDLAVLGGITGRTTSTFAEDSGINNSQFRSGADIGTINASTAVSSAIAIRGDAIATSSPLGIDADGDGLVDCTVTNVSTIGYVGGTIFSAFGSIGNINVSRGDISGVVFMAGYDIGSDMSFDGMASAHDFLATTPESIGNITVSNGDIHDTAFTAGVATQDNILGNADDAVVVPGSSIGTITALKNGAITNVVIEAGNLFAGGGSLQANTVNGLNILTGGDVGNVLIGVGPDGLVGTADDFAAPGVDSAAHIAVRAGGNIGNIFVANASAAGGDAINDSTFVAGYQNLLSNATIGNINALTRGGALIDADAIDSSCFIATGSIGTVTATVNNPGGVHANDAIAFSHFHADFNDDGNGSIGNILATTNGTEVNTNAIIGTEFTAGGNIGTVTANSGATAVSAGDDAIQDSEFSTGGNIGDISATSFGGHGIVGSTFTADDDLNGTGRIGDGTGVDITVVTSGANGIVNSDGILDSDFRASSGIGDLRVNVSNVNGGDGIQDSTFVANVAGTGNLGNAVGTDAIKVTSVATAGSGIVNSTFTANNIFNVTIDPPGGRGIHLSTFNAVENIGNITVASGGDGISSSNFLADTNGNNVGSIGVVNVVVSGAGNGIVGSLFRANSGIGNVTANVTTISGFSGILNTTFDADLGVDGTGAIGDVTANTAGFPANGIGNSIFRAGAGIGVVNANVTSTLAGSAISGSSFDADVDRNGTGGIVSVTGLTVGANAAADGISTSTFLGATIGPVRGESNNAGGGAGIDQSFFRATNGNIGTILAKTTALDGDGLRASGFNASGNIGAATITGHLTGSALVAGRNLGADFSLTGVGLANPAASAFGFGGAGANADVNGTAPASIGTITLTTVAGGTAAEIRGSTLMAGITGAGADAVFGLNGGTLTSDDTVLAGTASSIGNIVAPGGVTSSLIESGVIGTTTVTAGNIIGANYLALATTLPGGVTTGLGAITVTHVIPAAPSGAAGDHVALGGVTNGTVTNLYSNTNIGSIAATITGARTNVGANVISAMGSGGNVIGLQVLAGTTVGDVTATNNTTGTGGLFSLGIYDAIIRAGRNDGAAGGVGNITGQVITNTAGQGFGIRDLSVDGSAGAGSTGNIGAITGSTVSTGGGSVGIFNDGFFAGNATVFRTNGNIGNITGSTGEAGGNAISGSGAAAVVFSGSGNIGTVTATGAVLATKFLAGFDIGANLTIDGADVAVAGRTIGNVSATGSIQASTIAASVDSGADTIWGNADDTNATGGTIGTVTVTLPVAAAPLTLAAANVNNAITADTVGVVNFGGDGAEFAGGAGPADLVVDANGNAVLDVGTDIRVRVF